MGAARSKSRRDPANDWRLSPFSLILAGTVRALARTLDFRFHGEAPVREHERLRSHFILAFWHRHLAVMRYAYHGERMTVLSSQSWDGELSARTQERLGVECVRGSSSRGGASAMREIVRRARQGSDLAFTPDGPRGPVRVAQPGILLAASLSGFPVFPVAIGATRARLLRTWDRMILPLPGARVEIVFGEALRFARDGDSAAGLERLTAALNTVEARAAELAGMEAA